MSASVADKVIHIIADHAKVAVDEVRLDMAPADLGLDSLGLVEMVFAIEEAFDIQVPFNANATGAAAVGPQAFDISSVAAVVAAVQSLVAAKA